MANKSPNLLNNDASRAIKSEISRFESVHPNIYAIYELLDQFDDADVSEVFKDTIKEYVVSIEDSFVNSQEWTLPRFVNVLRLGIIGAVKSGKSTLVHRYLTGTYIHDESPEGGRFKKEVTLDGLSCLLLIRDEGGCPDKQLSQWVDGVIFVFSLENEESLSIVTEYYQQMCVYRNMTDLPILLIGTQDAISDSNPRVIDDSKARRVASSLGRAAYFETCATYGLNVERVFIDVCSKMVLPSRPTAVNLVNSNIRSRPTTPHVHSANTASPYPHGALTQPKRASNELNSNFSRTGSYVTTQSQSYSFGLSKDDEPIPPPLPARPDNMAPLRPTDQKAKQPGQILVKHSESVQNPVEYEAYLKSLSSLRSGQQLQQQMSLGALEAPPNHVYSEYNILMSSSAFVSPTPVTSSSNVFDFSVHHRPEKSTASSADGVVKDPPTPGSTPTQNRKVRRKSHLFKTHSEREVSSTANDKGKQQTLNGIGSGRSIPLKQGYLYKKSSNQINKDRKNRKYVTLTEDGKLTYYPNMNDYMNQVRGKDIDLQFTSIKLPGVPYRNSCLPTTGSPQVQASFHNSLAFQKSKDSDGPGPTLVSDSMTTAYLLEHGIPSANADSRNKDMKNKRHRRMKSNSKIANDDDQELYEFILIGCDNRQWQFDASSQEERDDWIVKIESVVLQKLQLSSGVKKNSDGSSGLFPNGSSPNVNNQQFEIPCDNSNNNNNSIPQGLSASTIANMLRSISGNETCSDCGSPDPCWASLNLGILICIECSGVHRQLGTHLSRVRSIQLDEWSKEQLAVMQSIGNTLANSVWEASMHATSHKKPEYDSTRSEKEVWIRAKYEKKQFLPPLPYLDAPIQQQLIDAITRQDTRQVILCLALAGDAVNAAYSEQDPRTAIHIAATLGNVIYLQLLLWYNGNPSVTDNEGRNAFFYAYYSGQLECADFLLRNSGTTANAKSLNCQQDDPLSTGQYRCQSSCLTMNPLQQLSTTAAVAHANLPQGATLPRRRQTSTGIDQQQPSKPSTQHRPMPLLMGNNNHNNNNHTTNGHPAVLLQDGLNSTINATTNNNYIDFLGSNLHNASANIPITRGASTRMTEH